MQFLFVAVTGYFSQFDSSRPPVFLRPNRVPIRRWLVNIVLFFTINVLNNHAFSYNISVPIHIILRSGGSITTLVAGYLWGKRFTRIQVIAVTLLTIGVVTAAWSDQQSKVSYMFFEVSACVLTIVIRTMQRYLKKDHLSVQDWPFSSWLRSCLRLWDFIQKRHTNSMVLTGRKICSIHTSSPYRCLFHSYPQWKDSSSN